MSMFMKVFCKYKNYYQYFLGVQLRAVRKVIALIHKLVKDFYFISIKNEEERTKVY